MTVLIKDGERTQTSDDLVGIISSVNRTGRSAIVKLDDCVGGFSWAVITEATVVRDELFKLTPGGTIPTGVRVHIDEAKWGIADACGALKISLL